MKEIAITPEVQKLLDSRAVVAIGCSGGKDSTAVVLAVADYLKGYEGPKLLLHADLLEVEWADSWPACQRVAEAVGWELATCTRKAGGMMQRWESRWESSKRRYCAMETVAVVLPWSTPSMRFCSGELKVDPITSYLKKRYGKTPIINVTGVRGEESKARAKQPVCAPGFKLPPGSLVWRPIHEWLLQDVWDAIAESGVEAHEAYTKFGSTRVSCRWCILGSQPDLKASLLDPAGHPIYRRMCDLELSSFFAFQGSYWLSSLAPELLENNGEHRLRSAQRYALVRKEAEAWIPKHLQFTKGWPHCVPTADEANRLANMRYNICHLYGWESPYQTGRAVRDRYQELWDLKQSKTK